MSRFRAARSAAISWAVDQEDGRWFKFGVHQKGGGKASLPTERCYSTKLRPTQGLCLMARSASQLTSYSTNKTIARSVLVGFNID